MKKKNFSLSKINNKYTPQSTNISLWQRKGKITKEKNEKKKLKNKLK